VTERDAQSAAVIVRRSSAREASNAVTTIKYAHMRAAVLQTCIGYYLCKRVASSSTWPSSHNVGFGMCPLSGTTTTVLDSERAGGVPLHPRLHHGRIGARLGSCVEPRTQMRSRRSHHEHTQFTSRSLSVQKGFRSTRFRILPAPESGRGLSLISMLRGHL